MRRSIAWLRRDLRLTDNCVLSAATDASERVWPVFVVDPQQLDTHAAAPGRVAWFATNVRALDEELGRHGSGLSILTGPPEQELLRFARAVGAEAVFAAADEDPAAIARDARVAATVDLRLVDDTRLVPPDAVRTASGGPYAVFSPYRRALDAAIEVDPTWIEPARTSLARLALRSETIRGPEAWLPLPPHDLPEPGEAAAAATLRAFLRRRLADYRDDRDRPGADATSHLSPYLRVGAISIRAAWRAALNADARARERDDRALGRGASAWRRELAWREFFAHVLRAHPRLVAESFRAELDGLAWLDGAPADRALLAWRQGRTGYPLVDAGMRQMAATGWMHNRARLVTASFLVKDLGIDWRRGESVFMEHLLDGDVSPNNGNWQWVAGVGTDAAPYFRVLNPTLQARRFDPDGAYVRRWVPELIDVPDEHVLEPWTASRPPRGYPGPILDHAAARQRALSKYAAATPAGSR
jgi:deoxyribodipyrimidine photo-lyase